MRSLIKMRGLIKNIFVSLINTIGILASHPVLAAISGWGYNSAPVNVPNDLVTSLMNITNWILGFIAIVAVLVLIVAVYNPAGLEDQGATNKRMFTYGIVGLVTAGIGYAIINIVIGTWLR